MGFDLLLNRNGDFSTAPHNDVAGCSGEDLLKQRIYLRLVIPRGWELDSTGGELGSRLHELLRLPGPKAKDQVEVYVREALEPMPDIIVSDIQVFTKDDDSSIDVGKIKLTIRCQALSSADVEPSSVTTTVIV